MLMSRIAKALRRVLGLYTEAEVQQYIDRAREEGRLDEQDRLAFELFERGGFATLQLNPNPTHIPRMRFVDPSKAQPVAGVRLNAGRCKPTGLN